MKVLINSGPLLNRKTGIGYCIENIVKELEKKDLDLLLSHNSNGVKTNIRIKNLSDNLKKYLGRFYPYTLAASLYNIIMAKYLNIETIRDSDSLDIDIYHEMSHVVLRGVFDKFKIKRFIADIHDISPVKLPQFHLNSLVKLVSSSLETVLSADILLTKSEFSKREISDTFGISENKIKVVPNAPSYPYKKLCLDKKEIRNVLSTERLSIPNKPFILYTGTIEPRKNLSLLIEAFSKFKYKKDYNLVIAGGFGWKYESVVKLPIKLGVKDSVFFLGYQPTDIFELLYNSADFFVYPSFYEGFGMPNIEAMCCGLPVITSNTSCFPEIVGDAALLFDPYDVEDLICQMERLADSVDLADELSDKGFLQAAKYSWESIGEQIYSVYKDVM